MKSVKGGRHSYLSSFAVNMVPFASALRKDSALKRLMNVILDFSTVIMPHGGLGEMCLNHLTNLREKVFKACSL